MNKQITNVEREALVRQLEHHLEHLCIKIFKDLNEINDIINVTQDNFEYMTYVGDSLEALQTSTAYVKEYLLTIKTAEKMIDTLLPIKIKEE